MKRSGVKNPEYIGVGIAAVTLWILRSAQNDEHCFWKS